MGVLRVFILCLLILGCGTRKAEIDKLKTETRELNETVLKLKNDIQSNVKVTKVANKTTVEPINEGKESTFNGTSFKNARIVQEEERTDSTATLNDQSEKEVKTVNESESSTKIKSKDIKTEKPNPWLWLMLTVVIVFALVYFRPWVKK